jgi:hypothetical protein
MSTPDKPDTDPLLDDHFAAARAKSPAPDDAFLARLEADARQMQPAPPRPTASGRLRQLVEVLGGWPAMGGLATASLVGLWIGVASPLGLLSTGLVSGDAGLFDLSDLGPGLDAIATDEVSG